MEKLIEKAKRLSEIESQWLTLRDKKILEKTDGFETMLGLMTEASSLVNELMLDLATHDPDTMEIQDDDIRRVLKKKERLQSVVAYEALLHFLKESSNGKSADVERPDFFSEYWDELFDIFHSKFDINSYFSGKLEIGPLITSISVPPTLKSYFSELREAYAHGLNKACVALCRTLLEVSFRDRLIKEERYRNALEVLRFGKDKKEFDFSLLENINIAYSFKIISKDFKKKADGVRITGNKIVHTKESNSSERGANIYEIVKHTIEIIESLYR